MRKRINSIFLAMLALFAFQGNVSAQDVVYEATFNSNAAVNEWSVEGDIPAWQLRAYNNWQGASDLMMDPAPYNGDGLIGYVISPSFTLGTDGYEVSFNHKRYGYENTPVEELAKLVIRETGTTTWTDIPISVYPENNVYANSGNLPIPADFNGKDVQIAFKHITAANNGGCGQVWYVQDIKVTKAAGGSAEPELSMKTLFSIDDLFNCTYNGFTREGYIGMDDWYSVWYFGQWGGPHGAKAEYIVDGDTNIEAYLVTPVIKMFEENSIEINHSVVGYAEGDAAKYLSLCIREEGTKTWENIPGVEFFAENTADYTEVNIDPKYNGKKVQFGFKYTAADKATAGTWYLNSIDVYGMAPDPVEPGFSFDVTEVKYEVGSRYPFESPVLNNPNEVKVQYSTSDWGIADVDMSTGVVTIRGEKLGKVTITAKSEASVEYLAGEVSYTINVVDPILVFKAKFQNDNEGFVEETTSTNVWKFDWGKVVAQTPVETATTSYYVSPEITIPAEGALVSFDHGYQNIANISEHAGLCVREVGGEWKEIAIENWPAENSLYDMKNTGDLVVPAEFNGKTVQFGLRFTLDATTLDGGWDTKYAVCNFIVTKYIDRAESGLAFNVSEYKYYVTENFEAPVLSNPNNLTVQYRSENVDVATIDIETGEITIKEPGITTIYAESQKNNEFKAGSASFKLEVIDPTIIFAAKLSGEFSGFTTESPKIWTADGYANTSAYASYDVQVGEKAYLVSPVIKLAESGNYASWQENGTDNLYDYSSLAIRLEGGEWQEIAGADRDTIHVTSWLFAVKDLKIPAEYNGKDVQIAFVFTNTDPNTNYAGWNISKFKVTRDFVKADPALAFDKEAVKITLGDEFTAPVLTKPEEVKVTYSSSDETVAKVDAEGVVTIVGKGETTIKAVSAEHALYLAGEASYVLTVINPVDPEIAFSETEVIYNAKMGEFVAPEFINPNNVEVTFSSSDEAVAKVDAATGVVELLGDGDVTITATSVATDEFISGTASYTIKISELTGIEGVTMEDLMNGKVYDLQGNRVQNIVKGAIYIVNGKKVIIK